MTHDYRLDSILGSQIDCECGREHRVPVNSVTYSEDAITELSLFLGSHIRGRSAVLMSDERTHEVAGRQVASLLESGGWSIKSIRLDDEENGDPVCDDRTFHSLCKMIPAPVDVFIAVGGGVISDLTKWVSFEKETPYVVVPTAASMNGFTAANVAPTLEGVKSLVRAHAPLGVFALPSVIEQAPFRLNASGLGDAVAKSVCAVDWEMNHFLLDEHFCPFCAEIISDIEPLYFDHPEAVADRSAEGIEAVFNALIYSGLAMTMIGTSAPASGGEHLFSHTLDMMSLVDGIPHDLHGRQVGLGTLLSAALYDRLTHVNPLNIRDMPETIDHGFWGRLAGSVASQYETKKKNLPLILDRLKVSGAWESLRNDIFVKAKSPDDIARCLEKANAARFIQDIDCTRERALQAILHLHEIRSRFTVVDLAWLAGILPGAADELIDQWLG